MLQISLDDAERVGVAHTALPALDDDEGVARRHDVELQRLRDAPLDAAVDVLLPVDLGEIGLVLREVEWVHAAVQVAVSGGGGVAGDHEDGAHGAVLRQQARGHAGGGQHDDAAGVEVKGRSDGRHGARLNGAHRPLDQRAELLEVRDIGDSVLGLEASCLTLRQRGHRDRP